MDFHAAPAMQRIARAEDLAALRFEDGVAAVTAPLSALAFLPLKNFEREDSPRLAAVERSIRRWGYRARDPVICRIGRKGRWIVVDGGHRLTALRRIGGGFWAWLFGPPRGEVYFLLYETARSWGKIDGRASSYTPADP